PTGSVRLGFGAGSIPFVGSAHGVEYTFNVTKSNEQFGDVITCYKGSGTYSVIYYNTSSSEVVAKLQVRKGKRWITQKRNASAFMPAASTEPEDPFSGSPFELSPWFHRYLYSNFGPVSTLGPKRRVTYEIKHGNKVLEQGLVSKKPCDKKRYF
ncbi:MAG TPA: hypothetical protein VLE74_02860, partial [Candidatus Saccharimonadales bacterium]|nr:hypothetical protein [Candidatus Saccharimonadales bacterium]